jgi:hypothetical protein
VEVPTNTVLGKEALTHNSNLEKYEYDLLDGQGKLANLPDVGHGDHQRDEDEGT